jgi:hypothetical protein
MRGEGWELSSQATFGLFVHRASAAISEHREPISGLFESQIWPCIHACHNEFAIFIDEFIILLPILTKNRSWSSRFSPVASVRFRTFA